MAKKVTNKTEGTPKKSIRAKRPASRAKSASKVETAPQAHSLDAVRARAFEIYASGRNPGDPVADWFQAEHELSSTSA